VDAPKVDFYLHSAKEPRARLTTVCRLAEKAYEQGLKVAVRTASPGETAEVDDLLWTFADRSFVPHGVWPAEPEFAAATAVLIGSSSFPATHRDVLINLAPDAPEDVSGYARVCEIVGGDDDSKQRARHRWRAYRGLGWEPGKVDV
jgi:DNA polymerase III subunit chi